MGNLLERLQRENKTKTFTVVITPTMEIIYMTYLQIIGIISALLSILIIFLIIFRSPSQTSAKLQFDMIALQICFLIFDIHVCCLLIPKSTLPYMAGYCMGPLCGSFSLHTQLNFALGVTLETLSMFFICLLQRYVSLTNSIHHSLTLIFIKTGCAILAVVAPLRLYFQDISTVQMINYVSITPKMLWLVGKRGWIVYFFSSTVNILDRMATVLMFIVVVVFSGGSVVLIKLISKYISKLSSTSSRSQSNHTIAIRNLILQFTVFSIFISLPMMAILVRLVFVLDTGTIVFFISELILCSHGLANSIVAIVFNSNFRRAITDQFSRNSFAVKRPSLLGITHHRPSIALPRF